MFILSRNYIPCKEFGGYTLIKISTIVDEGFIREFADGYTLIKSSTIVDPTRLIGMSPRLHLHINFYYCI